VLGLAFNAEQNVFLGIGRGSGSGWEKREQRPGAWKWQGVESCNAHGAPFSGFFSFFLCFFCCFVLIGVFLIWLGPYCEGKDWKWKNLNVVAEPGCSRTPGAHLTVARPCPARV